MRLPARFVRLMPDVPPTTVTVFSAIVPPTFVPAMAGPPDPLMLSEFTRTLEARVTVPVSSGLPVNGIVKAFSTSVWPAPQSVCIGFSVIVPGVVAPPVCT